MSGLLALLDDVAAIAKVAAASVDDVMGQAAKAGAKTAGALIDDAAVTPKYIQGFEASRELPIIGRIALGSIRNKLLILLPVGLLLSAFAPWAIPPLLMLGGAYLCFEGAEKIYHLIRPAEDHDATSATVTVQPQHLEQARIKGAIKTDFILSAEIMTIALAAIPQNTFVMEAATLAVVAVGITVMVYGAVALIVKADDAGLFLANRGRLAVTRTVGRAIVRAMPGFLRLLTMIGTAAMLWVGGAIVIHGLEQLGFYAAFGWIETWATGAAHSVPPFAAAAVEWSVTALIDGLLGVFLGLLLIPLVTGVIAPIWRKLRPGKA